MVASINVIAQQTEQWLCINACTVHDYNKDKKSGGENWAKVTRDVVLHSVAVFLIQCNAKKQEDLYYDLIVFCIVHFIEWEMKRKQTYRSHIRVYPTCLSTFIFYLS